MSKVAVGDSTEGDGSTTNQIGESQSRRTLESLPDELLMQIISLLPPLDLVSLHKTSNRSRDLTRRDPHLWRNVTIASHEEQLAQKERQRRPLQIPLPPIINDQGGAAANDTGGDGGVGGGPDGAAAGPDATVSPSEKVVDREEGSYAHHLPSDIMAAGRKQIDWYEEWKWRFAPLRMEWLDHHSPPPASSWTGGSGGEYTSTDDDDDDNPGLTESSACSSSASSLSSLTGNCLDFRHSDLEVRGMTAFPSIASTGIKDMLLSPLSDGSVAVFDLRRFGRRKQSDNWDDEEDDDGWRVLGRSKQGLVSVEIAQNRGSYIGGYSRPGAGAKTTRAPNGVVECVSVDPWHERGWVAVEGKLIEIDLHTLKKTATHSFPFSITSLSQTSHPFPLTVCTTNMIHLHDPRISPSITSAAPTMANLHQTGAVSILHSNNGEPGGGSEMIYVAGRFKFILLYERRMFPKLNTMHSGARLCTLSAFPSGGVYSNCSTEDTLEQNGESSSAATGSAGGIRETIVAGGEYNGCGSLELYPPNALSQFPNGSSSSPTTSSTRNGCSTNHDRHGPPLRHFRRYNHGVINPTIPTSNVQADIAHSIATASLTTNPAILSPMVDAREEIVVRNRQSASRSKILTVDAGCGTRLVTGDAHGVLRWVERDGRMEVRRFNLFQENSIGGLYGAHNSNGDSSPYSTQPSQRTDGPLGTGTRSEVVRKAISFGNSSCSETFLDRRDNNTLAEQGVVVWTGERVGVVSVGQQRRPRRRSGVRRGRRKSGRVMLGVGVVDEEEGEGGEDGDAGVVSESELEERYAVQMRRALETQGEDLRVLSRFGCI